MVQDPTASAGTMIEAGRLGIRSVVDSAIFVIAADDSINNYFNVLLAEVTAGDLSGFQELSKNLTDFFSKKSIGGEMSINDLRDKEFSGVKLSVNEKKALTNFDNYRISLLNAQENEDAFHSTYRQLQVIANLGDWQEFLKADYEAK